jgi:hypothetical protein
LLNTVNLYPQVSLRDAGDLSNFRVGHFIQYHGDDQTFVFFQQGDALVKGGHLFVLIRNFLAFIFDDVIGQLVFCLPLFYTQV